MKVEAVRYWNSKARKNESEARDAILSGFRGEREFDVAGRIDAGHLVLPFISRRDTVIDVGCGIGRLMKWVAPHCSKLVGLDVSEEMLKRAKRRLSGFSGFQNISLRKLGRSLRFPIANSFADFVYFYHVSEHMDREDAFTILGEIRRCLKPSGHALIEYSLITHSDNQSEFLHWAKEGDADGVRSRFYTEQEAAMLLEMAELHPQVRLYIPGEFTVVVSKKDARVLGEMPLMELFSETNGSARFHEGRGSACARRWKALLRPHRRGRTG